MSSALPDAPADREPDACSCAAELFRQLVPRMQRLMARYRLSAADAEDVLQEVFLLYLLRRDSVRDSEAWLMGTLRKRCLIHWRRLRVNEARFEPLEPIESLAHVLDAVPVDRLDVTEALGRLCARDRQLLVLRYVLEHSGAEIDRALGTSAGTGRQLVRRALERFRRALTDPNYVPQNTTQRHPLEAPLSLH